MSAHRGFTDADEVEVFRTAMMALSTIREAGREPSAKAAGELCRRAVGQDDHQLIAAVEDAAQQLLDRELH